MTDKDFTIRDEMPGDAPAIRTLIEVAFEPMPYGDGTDGAAMDKLRDDGDLVISLVAEQQGVIIGQVAFSPATVPAPGEWFGLGPVAVEISLQGRGIGSALIETGLERLRDMGAAGCVLIGNPDYYSRFGFCGDGALSYRTLERRLVQWLCFEAQPAPSGEILFSAGLEITPL